jgi:hypothetical protein
MMVLIVVVNEVVLVFFGGSEIINLSLFSENLTPPPFFSLYLSTLVDSLSLSLSLSLFTPPRHARARARR